MSKFNCLVFLTVILLICGCERSTIIHEEIEYIDKPHEPCVSKPAPIYHPGEMLHGRVSGLKNCLPFMGSAELYFFETPISQGSDIFIYTFEDWGNHYFVRKEKILVGAVCSTSGTYSMYIPATNGYEASYSTLQDLDVLEDVFSIDTSYSKNEITFTLMDRTIGHVQGFFNCRFLLTTPFPSGHNPDTVIFNDCYFDAWKR